MATNKLLQVMIFPLDFPDIDISIPKSRITNIWHSPLKEHIYHIKYVVFVNFGHCVASRQELYIFKYIVPDLSEVSFNIKIKFYKEIIQ